jgi:glycosyltransferase involved in cell wall biosynthesis
MKKKIIHVIDDLGRGGAETLLVDLLPDLSSEYEFILVTLRNKMEFDPDQVVCCERICLNYKGLKDIPKVSKKLKAIIKETEPHLVRSQLYWSTIIARLACPRHVNFFFSVHATMNEDPIAFHKKYFLNALEKLTYRSWQNMIGVTEAVIESFTSFHRKHGKTFLLHNFVRDPFFQQSYSVKYNGTEPLKLVAVSNIRLIKNIPYLVEVMKLLPEDKVQLDIYGDGPMRDEVESLIKRYGLKNTRLMGRRHDIYSLLPAYDVYISPSTVEGFGIAVAEAMSVGLPVVISDIPVYKEIGSDKALYLDNKNAESLKKIILSILDGSIDLKKLSENNKEYSRQMFSKQGYLSKLKAIYTAAPSMQ